MGVLLNDPKQSEVLDKVKIAAFKIELNEARYIEIWLIIGYETEGVFHQRMSPESRSEVFMHIKLEDAVHPITEQALSKCDTCGAWYIRAAGGPCTVEDCEGTLVPYDGFTRCQAATVESLGCSATSTAYEVIRESLYQFLLSEIIPDPEDPSVTRKILDATDV